MCISCLLYDVSMVAKGSLSVVLFGVPDAR